MLSQMLQIKLDTGNSEVGFGIFEENKISIVNDNYLLDVPSDKRSPRLHNYARIFKSKKNNSLGIR